MPRRQEGKPKGPGSRYLALWEDGEQRFGCI